MQAGKLEASKIAGLVFEQFVSGDEAGGENVRDLEERRAGCRLDGEAEPAPETQVDQSYKRIEAHMNPGIDHLLGQ